MSKDRQNQRFLAGCIYKGERVLSARATGKVVDEVEVIEDSADASRPFVWGRRSFYKRKEQSF